jgi:hypothetical protein
VHEAWLQLQRAEAVEIDNLKGWLTTETLGTDRMAHN